MAFVFYDTETTGIQTAYDQILQFGAIKTDNDLREVDRFEIRSRLQPHVVPSAAALIITKTSIAQLQDTRLPTHYEMVQQICAKLRSWGPARYVGYNSINFDEDLLRHSFFQTLHPLYLTNTQGSVRGDAMNIVQGLLAHAPDAIRIPASDKGGPSFKLDRLAPANGFNHDRAHDAMGDVEATIFLCNMVKQRAPDYWAAMMRTMSKQGVSELCEEAELVHFTGVYFGKAYNYVLRFCTEADGALVCFDVSNDPTPHVAARPDAIADQIQGKSKILRRIFSNKHPILVPISAQEGAQRIGNISPAELLRRIDAVKDNATYNERIKVAVGTIKEEKKQDGPIYLEDRIYEQFPNAADAERMRRFHAERDWEVRTRLAAQISDVRFREMANRLIYQHAPAALPRAAAAMVRQWKRDRIASDDLTVPWSTVHTARLELDQLAAEGRADAATAQEIHSFYDSLEANAGQ